MSSPVALIFGVGKNIGANVAKSFAENGYKVAIAARSSQHNLSESQYMHNTCDLRDASSVEKVFDAVRTKLGPPSVVIYNASIHKSSPDREAPLGLSLSDLKGTLDVNLFGAYVAAQQAVLSFESIGPDHPKAFIYTGNRTNIAPIIPLMSSGIGKSAAASMIAYLSNAYRQKGFRFFYADERTSDGAPVYMRIDGPAHGDFYLELARGSGGDVPWLATFVKCHGYKDFGETARL